jgi:protein SCO1
MRRASLPVLFAALVIAAVAGSVLWHLGDIQSQRVAAAGAGEESGLPAIGGPFSLTDQNGQPRTDKDYLGKYMLVYFGYTWCPDVCPTTLAVEAAALKKMGEAANRIAPIFISVDPKRDTPGKLKMYLAAFDPRFIGLTGTDAQVAAAAKGYRVYYKTHPDPTGGDNYTVDHSSVIYLMGPDGKFVSHYDNQVSPDAMAADLVKRTQG